jgi:AraC-like DNA-binding protein
VLPDRVRLPDRDAGETAPAGDTPVTKIAFTVGYSSLSAFNAAFQDLTGRTPTDYRASFRP